jgi:hypothetical protein
MLNRIHSRHVSRLSAALSLRSVGCPQDPSPDAGSPPANPMVVDLDLIEKETDAIAEWTGSEDPRGCSDEVLRPTPFCHPPCFLRFSRRVLENGPTRLTKNTLGKNEGRDERHAARKARCKMSLADYRISHDLLQPPTFHYPIKQRTTSCRIQAMRKGSQKRPFIHNSHPLGLLATDDRCLPSPTRVQHPLSSHTMTLLWPIRE